VSSYLSFILAVGPSRSTGTNWQWATATQERCCRWAHSASSPLSGTVPARRGERSDCSIKEKISCAHRSSVPSNAAPFSRGRLC